MSKFVTLKEARQRALKVLEDAKRATNEERETAADELRAQSMTYPLVHHRSTGHLEETTSHGILDSIRQDNMRGRIRAHLPDGGYCDCIDYGHKVWTEKL